MSRKKLITQIILNAALLIISAACLIAVSRISSNYKDQREYERWRGDNELEFSQIEFFIPSSDEFSTASINAFRNDIVKGLIDSSIENADKVKLFVDCWSLKGSCTISSDKAYTKAPVIAVGGEFFDFHLMDFTSGTFFSEDSVYDDGVILDEELAWFLFGGTDVVGLEVNIDGKLFYITGVVNKPEDFANKKANTDEMTLYMPYTAYYSLKDSSAPITCYEMCLPNPVKNFALNLVTEKFPVKDGIITEVTDRFTYGSLFKVVRNISSRSMSSSVPYPFWENAARYAESVCSILLLLSVLCVILPIVNVVRLAVKYGKAGKKSLESTYIPRWKDSIEEKIRISQRKRWEKKHPGMK